MAEATLHLVNLESKTFNMKTIEEIKSDLALMITKDPRFSFIKMIRMLSDEDADLMIDSLATSYAREVINECIPSNILTKLLT